MKKESFLRFLTLLMLLFCSSVIVDAATLTRLQSIDDIDESAEYVLGISGSGMHSSGTSSWGKCSKTESEWLKYTLVKASDGKSFKAYTTISGTKYYLQVPTSNTFSMATTSSSANTDMIIGTSDYAVANKSNTSRHIRLNGTSGLRSYANATGDRAYFYKVESTAQPLSATAKAGNGSNSITVEKDESVTLTCTAAGGTSPYTYQWYASASSTNSSGTAISGATSATYSVNTSEADTYYYYCQVNDNNSGSAKSNVVTVVVNDSGSGGGEGGDVVTGTFTKVTSGTIDAGNYIFVGDGDNNYALINNTLSNNWIYGTSTEYSGNTIVNPSKTIVWTVDTYGKIHPYGDSSKSLYSSAAKKIEMSSSNSTNWSFSYSNNKWDISGDSSIGNLQYNSTGWRPYTGSTGTAGFQIYKISTPQAPAFTTQPVGATYDRNAAASPLTVAASGNPTPTYQWYSNSSDSTSGATAIAGATSASYTPSTATVGTTYYYCVASNSQGDATSEIVAVTVNSITYTVTYDANGGSGTMTDTTSYEEGSSVTILTNTFTREGYTFTGWKDQNDNTVAEPFVINANTTLYAQWTKNPATVTLVAGTGAVSSTTITETEGGAGVDLPEGTIGISGWVFAGWATATCDETTTAPTLIPAGQYIPEGNITLYAVYSKSTGASPTPTLAQTLQYDTWTYSKTSGTTADKTTYRLFGNGAYVESAAFDLSTLNKVIVYGGTFGGDSYNGISIKDENGNVWKTGTVSGKKETGENTFTEGTSLSGNKKLRIYSTSGNGSDNGVRISKIEIYTLAPAVMYNSNPPIPVLAAPTFTTQPVGATYDHNAEAAPLTVEASGNPTPTYKWYKNSTNSTPGATAIEGATSASYTPSTETVGTTYYYCVASNSEGDATSDIVAVTVTPITYTLTYDANGGEGEMADTNSYEADTTVAILPNTFTREGYTFAGWNTEADGSGTPYAADSNITLETNTTLYAQWTVNTYTVTWKVNGNIWGTPTVVEYNAKPVLPTAPTATDFDGEHQFVGWTAASTVDSENAPADLFTTADGAPAITADGVVFNAVFAATTSSAALYETVKFESSEGYTPASTYNSSKYSTGSAGSKWKINYGAFSTSGAISGEQSAQFRIYNGSNGGFGQLYNSVAYEGDISHISFSAKTSSTACNVKVSSSANGSNWADIKTINLTTGKATYEVDVPEYARYFKFTAVGTRPKTGNIQIYIDDVAVTCGAVAYDDYMITASTAIQSISVNTTAATTLYGVGDALSVNGVVVTANYDDGSTKTVSRGITFDPEAGTILEAAGSQTVNVTYGGKSTSYTIDVKYRLSYDANGGEGSVDDTLCGSAEQATVASGDGLTRTNYHFTGWNTEADGSGTPYAAGDAFTLTANTVLYAQWAVDTYTVTYNPNGGTGVMTDDDSPYEANAWVSVLNNSFTRTGYNFTGWNTAADGSGETYYYGDSFRITADVTLYAQWNLRGENFTIFHEGFGDNITSAREWKDDYKEQSGVATVYANAEYALTNAKQSKYNVGAVKSGLVQSSSSTEASFVVGPLNLASYADGTDVTLSYKWKAASVNGTYYTKVYYATSASGDYTEIENDAVGATSFVDVSVLLPADALVATAYIKVAFSTSNTQAFIDEFDLSGKLAKAVPDARFDLPVYFVNAGGEIDIPEHVSVSSGVVTHISSDDTVASIGDATITGGSTHGSSAVVNATIAETDDHASANAAYVVTVAPMTVTLHPVNRYTPFSSHYNLDFSKVDGIKPYVVYEFGVEQSTGIVCALIKEVTGGKVPAGNGVILEATTADVDYIVPVDLEADLIIEDNFLIGALSGTAIPYSDSHLVRFAFDTDGRSYIRLEPGATFATANGAAHAIAKAQTFITPDDTAYLELPKSDAEPLNFSLPLGIKDDKGIVTGVENVVVRYEGDGGLYNVLGRPVTSGYNGVIITKGGKYLNK